MARLALLAGLLATVITTVRGVEPPVPGFNYVGCVQADVSQFPVIIDFVANFQSRQCPPACGGQNSTYAALGSGCHCSDPASDNPIVYDIVGESNCSVECIPGSVSAGHCGGVVKDIDAPYRIFNLYKQVATL